MEVLILKGVNALVQRRMFIIGLTILMGLVGAVRGMVWPTYQAQTVLLLTQFGATGESGKALAVPPPAKIYQNFVLSPQVVGMTLERLMKNGDIPEDEVPEIDDFTSKLKVSVETVDATTRPITYSPLVRLEAPGDTQELAIATVTTWAEVVMEQANKMLALPLAAVAKSLNEQRDASQAKLDGIWTELAREKSEYDLELMRVEADLQLKQLDLLVAEEVKVRGDLEGFQKSLEAVRLTLTQEKPFHELAAAPSDAAYWIVEGAQGGKTIKDLADKVMVSQHINAVYWDNKAKEGALLSDIAANEARLAVLTKSIEQLRGENKALKANLGEHSIRQRELESQETVAKKVYEDVATSSAINDAMLGTIQTADGEFSPVGLNPMSDRVFAIRTVSLLSGRRAAFVGALLGLLLSVGFVLLRDVWAPWWRWAQDKYSAAA